MVQVKSESDLISESERDNAERRYYAIFRLDTHTNTSSQELLHTIISFIDISTTNKANNYLQ